MDRSIKRFGFHRLNIQALSSMYLEQQRLLICNLINMSDRQIDMFIKWCQYSLKIIHYKVRIRRKPFFKTHYQVDTRLYFLSHLLFLISRQSDTYLYIFFVVFLYGSLNRYAHANDIREIDTLC